MPRKKREDGEAFGSDSFLDIVANMVGILIVLVIVAGLRAKQAGHGPAADVASLAAEVKSLADESKGIEAETLQLADEIEALQGTAASRYFERDTLELAVVAGQQELAERRKTLDADGREQYDLNRDLVAAEDALQAAITELARSLTAVPTTVTKVETYPTPISHTVVGREIHYQLKGGRVALVPMDELVKLFESDAQQKLGRLREQPEVIETIGPIGGFHLRYTLERVDVPQRGGGVASRLAYGFKLLPVSSDLGEPWEAALQPGSEFRASLSRYGGAGATVTLWTYPDSFAAYRALKKGLYLQGFAVAGRPMPDGQEIGASPGGSKSSAQ